MKQIIFVPVYVHTLCCRTNENLGEIPLLPTFFYFRFINN